MNKIENGTSDFKAKFVMESEYEDLIDIVRRFTFKWPEEYLCVSQESDGLLIWWKVPTEKVKEAKASCKDLAMGLIPMLGRSAIAHLDYYVEKPKKVVDRKNPPKNNKKQQLVGKDWMVAVISKESI